MNRTAEDSAGPFSPGAVAGFRLALAAWFAQNARPLPWRETSDPYRIWLSEVMLQQTRVEQARPYFDRFVERFPTVEALAASDLDEVLRLWEGLGYYSRARNLHRAARTVSSEFGGRFPTDHKTIRSLPGVGEYTAAAVGSIAFGLPHAAVDGNVFRVLSRISAESGVISLAATRNRLRGVAETLLDPAAPGQHNEALMELGATVCTPRSPACPACPVRSYCVAHATDRPEDFPVRAPRKPIPHVDVAVGIVRSDQGILIQRRPVEAMLGGLWEFPGGKILPGERPADACRRELREELGIEVTVGDLIDRIDHAYSHFRVTLHAFDCRIESGEPVSREAKPVRWIVADQVADYAFPRANRQLLDRIHPRPT